MSLITKPSRSKLRKGLEPLRVDRSLIDKVYDRLVDAIGEGTLPPGTRLTQQSLAETLAVSRQPISHALQRLKAAGLAVEAGKRGLVVASMDLNRVRDIFEVRAVIDGLSAKLAAQNVASHTARTKDIQGLKTAFEHGLKLDREVPRADWLASDSAFHNAIYRLAGNVVIIEAIMPMWMHLRRSMITVPAALRRQVVWDEHRAIIDAILSGDEATAERVGHAHVLGARDALMQRMKEQLEQAERDPVDEDQPLPIGW
jgi:DNA-binding GntR family transcriptional regulator